MSLRPTDQETEGCRKTRGSGRGRELRSRLLEGPGKKQDVYDFCFPVDDFKETQAQLNGQLGKLS